MDYGQRVMETHHMDQGLRVMSLSHIGYENKSYS